MHNEDNFVSVTVCLDCGKLATDNCYLDPRTKDGGDKRVDTVLVYPEDMPLEDCDCHVKVKWCDECNAVANDYCKKLASVGKCTLSERALVKLTQKEVDDIAAAAGKGLWSQFVADNYIYLVDESGRASAFTGLKGDKNVGVNAPYLVCDKHTKEDWQESQKPTEPTEPDEPTEPSEPDIEFPLFPEDPLRPGWGT